MRLSPRSRLVLGLLLLALLGLAWLALPGGGGRSADDASGQRTGSSRSTSSSRSGGQAGSSVGSGLQPGSTDPDSGLQVVALDQLPAQAARTVELIRAGGPFPYRQDGVVYHNANRVLPRKADGYYHEYTVKTPGQSSRGARRIVHGNGDEYYWTQDHYDSFRRIA
ncbi:ribonuclease domain-containing protein [Luteococcus peritonei]|uniref:Ribonuclease domain-containing protein n=1 Tax=Luteococcus peritonei TaxID=88874 RepID=A0ABW4RT82_9ACTN